MRHTKIIATVGPASDSDAMLDALIAAGTDIFRLNFSHGTHESQAATFARVRAAATRARREVAVLQDLGGPKIRTGALEGGRPLSSSRRHASRSRPATSSGGPGRVSTTFAGWRASVRPGDRLLLADGLDRAARRRHRRHRDPDHGRRRRRARRAQGHQRARRPAAGVGDHAEGRRRPARSVCRSASTWSRSASCRPPTDLRQARQLWPTPAAPTCRWSRSSSGRRRSSTSTRFSTSCDAVMVARGDLGLEMPLERVPRAQKEITRARPAPRHSGHRRDPGARVDDRRSRGRRAPKSTTRPTPSTTASTRSCWPAKRRPAPIPRAPCRRSTRSSATPSRAGAIEAVAGGCAGSGDRRSRPGALRGGGDARRARRGPGDRRRHARRQHGAAAVGAPAARADLRDHRRDDTARRLALYWGVVPLCTDIGENVDSAGTLDRPAARRARARCRRRGRGASSASAPT